MEMAHTKTQLVSCPELHLHLHFRDCFCSVVYISYFLSSGWLDYLTCPIDATPTAAALRWAMDPYTIGLAQADSERSTHVELDFEGGSGGGGGGGGSGGGQVLDPDLRRLDARMRQTSLLNEALARKNSYLASVLAQVS